MSDIEVIDIEEEINDVRQLTAVLETDKPISDIISRSSSSVASTSTASSYTLDEYSKIGTALALNKLTDDKLRKLENILIGRLRECREKLNEIRGLESFGSKLDKQETFHYINCGKPYFKDKSNFPAPDNDDTILMTKSQMYDFSNVTSVPGWTVKDKRGFLLKLQTMSQDIRKRELNSKIAQLNREAKKKDDDQIKKKIEAIKNEIDDVDNKTLKELALPIDQDYDWDTVANKLSHRHSTQEYRSLWKLYLHPSINKASWNKKEHQLLQEIAYKHKLQDWDNIAKELNTGRTGYQCFVYFRTNVSNTFTGQKWTKEEEEYLKRLIDYYREDDYIPWGKVAACMENKTKIQIYNKYSRLVEQRKGRFLPEEDAVILTCVDNFGTNFRKIMDYLPGRSAIQLRARYRVLAKRRTSVVWSIDEDKKLIQLMANQDSTINYSSITKYFPGKDRSHVRTRYLTLAKWMKQNPNLDIIHAPRRAARRLGHGHASVNLNKAVEKLKKRIESEVENKRSKKVTRASPEDVIEDAIITILVNENIQEEENKKIELNDEDERAFASTECLNATSLKQMLIFLKARLKKEQFEHSTYCEQYPSLLESETRESVKIKCYSRKDPINKVTTIKVNEPDIWGNSTLTSSEYVLPPHYATITGCRKLLAHVSTTSQKDCNPFNINILLRRNSNLKQQYSILLERFNSLFLWPMLLSNECPKMELMKKGEEEATNNFNDSTETI